MKKRFRQPSSEIYYKKQRQNNLNLIPFSDWTERIVKEYIYWIVIENSYPWDLISKTHHLLIPRRSFSYEWDMEDEERTELIGIKKELYSTYDMFVENCHSLRSIPDHFHIHCIITEDETNPEYDF